MDPRWDVVGRDDERSHISSVIARQKGPAGVLISGDDGVGKTSLARTCVEDADAIWIVGNRSTRDLPLGAVFEWTPPLPDTTDPSQVLRAAINALGERLGDGAVLIVDDAHHLDPLSALVVQRIVLGAHAPVLITARSKAVLPEAIANLARNDWLQRIDLEPLSESEVADLVAHALGHPVETHSLRRLLASTGGSMMFLRELIDHEVHSGGMHLEEGRWVWTVLDVVPHSIVDVVQATVDHASPKVREVCDLLALCEPLGIEVLESLSDAEAVKLAEASALCHASRNPHDGSISMRLTHPMMGAALRTALPPVRTRGLMRRLDEALAANTGGTDDRATLQRALLDAEILGGSDADLLIRGAEIASAWYDFTTAERLARMAERSGGGFAARWIMAAAQFRLGRVDDSARLGLELTRQAENEIERVAAGGLLAHIEHWGQGDTDAATTRITELSMSTIDPMLKAYPLAIGACINYFSGLGSQALDSAAALLDDPSLPNGVILWASAAATITAAMAGKVDQARAYAAIGHDTSANTRSSPSIRLPTGYGEIFALGLAGEVLEARRVAQSLESFTQAAGGTELSAAGSYFCGLTAWWAGDLAESRHRLEDALSELKSFSPGPWMDQALAALATTLAAQGHLEEATVKIHELDDRNRFHFRAVEPIADLARGWVDAAWGRVDDATGRARRAASAAATMHQFALEVSIWQAITRWGGAADVSRLETLSNAVEGPMAPLALRHARALAERDGAELDRVAAAWEHHALLGDAADAAAHAVAAHRRSGSRIAAHRASECALAIARRTGARTLPLKALETPSPLTKREAQVANLASCGRSNAQIAEDLYISVRTVEGHLNRIYAKLGIAGRDELRS